MAYVRIRRTCDIGEACTCLIVDTETGDALIGGVVDHAAAAELGFPPHEGLLRISARDVPSVLYDIGPDTFPGKVSP
ncbi:MAG: hypothetical protein ACRDRX_14090 [Pseudonocardiaceae bacterium]